MAPVFEGASSRYFFRKLLCDGGGKRIGNCNDVLLHRDTGLSFAGSILGRKLLDLGDVLRSVDEQHFGERRFRQVRVGTGQKACDLVRIRRQLIGGALLPGGILGNGGVKISLDRAVVPLEQGEELLTGRSSVEASNGIGDGLSVRDNAGFGGLRAGLVSGDFGDHDFAHGVNVADPETFERSF